MPSAVETTTPSAEELEPLRGGTGIRHSNTDETEASSGSLSGAVLRLEQKPPGRLVRPGARTPDVLPAGPPAPQSGRTTGGGLHRNPLSELTFPYFRTTRKSRLDLVQSPYGVEH